jgi:hypothetical protein
MSYELPADKKLYVNLSLVAWSVIDGDMAAFDPMSTPKKYSSFLNRIIANSYLESDASRKTRLDALSASLAESISKDHKASLLSSDEKSAVISVLQDWKNQELKDKVEHFGKGEGRRFFVNNENENTFCDKGFSESLSYPTLGDYVKALLETYARLPQIDRESIYFAKTFTSITQFIRDGQAIRLTVINRKIGQDQSTESRFLLKPYAIMADRFGMYHYLIGYGKAINKLDDEDETKMEMKVIRLSKIEDESVKKALCISGKIPEHIKADIAKTIAERGVQFLTDKTTTIKVRFTEKGKKDYNTQLYLRPDVVEIDHDDPYVYYFDCGPTQARFYFLKFGKDAKILEPKYLADMFKQFYKQGLEAYQDK